MFGQGAQARYEPNAYGLEIEALADACGIAGTIFTISLVIAMPMIRLHENGARPVTVFTRQVEG
jgi:hypothetical protein